MVALVPGIRKSFRWHRLSLVLAGLCLGCNPSSSSAPSHPGEYAALGDTSPQICDRLQRERIRDGNILEVDLFLKKEFPDWNEPRDTDPLSRAPWPPGFEECFVESKNEIRVERTTCHQFKDLLTNADAWKEIYSNAHSISAPGILTNGMRFAFRTFGSNQDCRVDADSTRGDGFTFGWTCDNTPLIPRALTRGQDVLPLGRVHHRWNCTETEGGTLISTEECQVGAAIEVADALLLGGLRDMMQRGHQVWLEGIKCKLQNKDWTLRTDSDASVS